MSYNYYKNNAFFDGGGIADASRTKSLDSIKSSGVTDLSMPSPSMSYDIDYEAVNTLFNTYTTSNFAYTTAGSALKNISGLSGAKVWATPTYNAAFETLLGVARSPVGVTAGGQFEKNMFDNPSSYPIQPSNFPGLTKGCVWYAMSIWVPGNTQGAPCYMGTVYINFPDIKADGTNSLKDLFYPVYSKRVEAFVVYGEYMAANTTTDFSDGHTRAFTDPEASWMMSSESSPSSNGYFNPGGTVYKMSANDGVWGFKSSSYLDGHGYGSLTSGTTFDSFGIQNVNSIDVSVDDVYWGDFVKATSNFRTILWTVT